MKRILLVTFVSLLVVASLFAGGAKEKKGYVFGSDATWPPLEFVDENGKLTGFEVELVEAMGEVAGVPMTVKNTAWDGIFAGLANNHYDAVASGVSVTEERKNSMDFTNPILEVTQSIIVNKSSAPLADGNALRGKVVGVQIGTTGHFAVEKIDGVTVKAYDDIGLAVEDLLNRNVDAAVADSLIASDFVLENDNYAGRLSVTGTVAAETEKIAIAVKKGNSEFLAILNEALATLEANGTMAALKEKWNIL
ncbi:MAG: basic amino acid ABC transporter substrate-binding protein [Sphaerochaetaceae bacterium]|jgi:polar amino acid transport system substrate-binding protein